MVDLESLCAELVCGGDVRAENAARQLPEYGREALDALTRLYATCGPDGRWWVIRALAGFGPCEQTTALLLTALRDGSEEVRQAAAMAFCHLPDPASLAPLAQALEDPDPMTAKLAANALISLDKQATQVLLDVLENGSQKARLEAARALAEIKDTRAVPGLIKAYENGSALLQYWAGLGLEHMGVGMVYLKPD